MADERVVAAARRLARTGAPPTVDAVATAAGVSRATIYRRFGSRDELLAKAGLEPSQESREAVLETASQLIQQRGLHGFTFEDLAAQAGVSRATVYRLFPGRPALLKGVFERYSPIEPVLAALEELGDQPPTEVMPELARIAAPIADRNRGLLLSLASDVARLDPEMLATVRAGFERIAGAALPYLLGQMDAGRIRRVHPLLALQAFMGPLIAHVLSRPALPSVPPLEEAVAELAAGWLRAYAL